MVVDPTSVSRVVTLLQSGTVMSTRFRTFENHLSFALQFLCDFGLYGCGWVELGNVLERGRNAEDEEALTPRFPVSPHFRQSRMPLEVDVAAYHILNRHRLTPRHMHHKLEIPAPPPPNEPFVPSVRELWEDERQRRSARGLNPSPEMPTVLSDVSRQSAGEWISEARWWDEIRKRMERDRGSGEPVTNYTERRGWENAVMSTFESIEALWEPEFKTWRPTRRNDAMSRDGADAKADSDESKPVPVEEGDEEAGVDVDVSVLETQHIDFNDAEWNDYEDEGLNELEREGEEQEEDADYGELEDNESVADDLSASSEEEGNGREDGGGDPDDVFSTDPQENEPSSSLFPDGFKEFPFNPREFSDNESDASDTSLNYWDPLCATPMDHKPMTVQQATDEQRQTSPSPPELTTLKRLRAEGEPEVPEPEVERAHKRSRTVKFDIVEQPDDESPPVQEASMNGTPTMKLNLQHRISRPSFKLTADTNLYNYASAPPTSTSLMNSLRDYGLPNRIYKAPHYSNELDAPAGPREYAGLVFELKGGDGIANLEEWVSRTDEQPQDSSLTMASNPSRPLPLSCFVGGWEYAGSPPSVKEVKKWLSSPEGAIVTKSRPNFRSQIKGPTQANIYGLKSTPIAIEAEGSRARQDMTVLSLEVFAPTGSGKLPDPKDDGESNPFSPPSLLLTVFEALFAAFYSFQTCDSQEPYHGVIVADPTGEYAKRLRGVHIRYVDSELELINEVLDVVLDLDPDLIMGWEVQNSSWGYLAARASQSFSLEVDELLARAPPRFRVSSEQYEARHTTTFYVAGRHVFNLWRIMRLEVTLGNYTFENVVFNVLGRRVPKYSPATITGWCRSQTPRHNLTFLQYFIGRTAINIDMLNQSEMLTKTA
ncbi:DNA polymerase zeta [Marasmius crinis-equi]|uniref:DNA polymerase zeta n=1 Tax=Marasmius crinis-equi TaxID=585013 RepID=A0ABR3ERS3_9AGAR